MARQVVDATLDLLEQVGDVLVIKRETAAQQGIQDDAAAPYIYFRAAIQLTRDDLRVRQTVLTTIDTSEEYCKRMYSLYCTVCQKYRRPLVCHPARAVATTTFP